jgi:predicted transcriptional regulator of viral defense system
MRMSLVWEKFLIENKKIITSENIKELAAQISKDGDSVIDYLQHNGYIVRILRGVFYVKSIEERERKKYDISIYEMVAMAMEKKGVKNWYFGFETALKLNTMTHEYFTLDYVLTDSFRTTKIINILGTRFEFIKRSGQHFKHGIVRKDLIRYSDKEKTVLDLAYKLYLNKKSVSQYMPTFEEYRDVLDMDTIRSHLTDYPLSFRNQVADAL